MKTIRLRTPGHCQYFITVNESLEVVASGRTTRHDNYKLMPIPANSKKIWALVEAAPRKIAKRIEAGEALQEMDAV